VKNLVEYPLLTSWFSHLRIMWNIWDFLGRWQIHFVSYCWRRSLLNVSKPYASCNHITGHYSNSKALKLEEIWRKTQDDKVFVRKAGDKKKNPRWSRRNRLRNEWQSCTSERYNWLEEREMERQEARDTERKEIIWNMKT